LRKYSGKEGAAVLMYHSVPSAGAEGLIDPQNAVRPRVFSAQIRFLARKCLVKTLEEVVGDIKSGRKVSPGTVVLTFDDGYADTFSEAAPILARYGLPATVFLATRYVDFGEPHWIDRLYSAFSHRAVNCLALRGSTPDENGQLVDLSNRLQRFQAYEGLKTLLLKATWEERAVLLSELESRLRPTRSPRRTTLTWEEVRELIERYPGFEIGVHSATHLALDERSAVEVEEELCECIRAAQRALGIRPRMFSYPYGRHTPAVRAAVAGCGFSAALATEPFHLVTHRSDPYHLPRLEAPRRLYRLKLRTTRAYPEWWPRFSERA